MNTLTHALVGAAVFGRPRLTFSLLTATLAGAAFPDVAILGMVFWEVGVNGTSEADLWGRAYYSEPWVTYRALTNSVFVFGGLAVLAWWRRWSWGLAFAGTAVLHFLGDVFLHYNDGHPHFWPLSRCVFYSPISYWDPAHYGLWWTGFEMLLAAGLAGLVWRQTTRWWARAYAAGLLGLFWALSLTFFVMVLSSEGSGERLESSVPGTLALPACPGSADAARPFAFIVSVP